MSHLFHPSCPCKARICVPPIYAYVWITWFLPGWDECLLPGRVPDYDYVQPLASEEPLSPKVGPKSLHDNVLGRKMPICKTIHYPYILLDFQSYHLVYVGESGCDKRVGLRRIGTDDFIYPEPSLLRIINPTHLADYGFVIWSSGQSNQLGRREMKITTTTTVAETWTEILTLYSTDHSWGRICLKIDIAISW